MRSVAKILENHVCICVSNNIVNNILFIMLINNAYYKK